MRRLRAAPWLACLLSLALGCRDDVARPVHVVAGAGAKDEMTLLPRASLAEYIEVSPDESRLLITLSSDARSCDTGTEAPTDAVSLSVNVVFPAGTQAEPGSYPMLEAGADPQKPHALPTAKLASGRVDFLPGGSLELRRLDLTHRGAVEGLLKFEFPGSADRPATRISGPFLAHFCRVNRLRAP